MNNAKKVSIEQNTAASVHAVLPLEGEAKGKSVLERIADYLIGSDLDLTEFKRIEGISRTGEREPVEPYRNMVRGL